MRFEADGAEYLHMVDLNGAAEGGARNAEIFCRVARTLAIPVELGGGIRDMKTDLLLSGARYKACNFRLRGARSAFVCSGSGKGIRSRYCRGD